MDTTVQPRWPSGALRVLHRLFAELLRRCGVRVFAVFRRRHHGISEQHEAGPRLDMRVVGRDELREAARDPELQLDEGFLAEAEARGDLCVGAFVDGRLVSYLWRAFEPLPAEDGFWVRFDPTNRYGYKAFTLPAFRGRRIQSALAPTTDALLLERGYTHAISYTESDNFASIRSSLRHGNARVGYAVTIDALGFRRAYSSPGARAHGFAFFDPG